VKFSTANSRNEPLIPDLDLRSNSDEPVGTGRLTGTFENTAMKWTGSR